MSGHRKNQFMAPWNVSNSASNVQYNRRYSMQSVETQGDMASDAIFRKDDDGDTMLHLAIINRDNDLAIKFISRAPTQKHLSLQNNLFQTPLHLAAITDLPEVAAKLVSAGADMTSQDRNGDTVFHIACRYGNYDVLLSLLKSASANEGPRAIAGITSRIQYAFAIKNGDGVTCLHLAVQGRHMSVLNTLTDYNININMKAEKSGRTVLHDACDSGDMELVKFLLQLRNCDIDARARDNSTPFDLARGKGHEDVCRFLASTGAERR